MSLEQQILATAVRRPDAVARMLADRWPEDWFEDGRAKKVWAMIRGHYEGDNPMELGSIGFSALRILAKDMRRAEQLEDGELTDVLDYVEAMQKIPQEDSWEFASAKFLEEARIRRTRAGLMDAAKIFSETRNPDRVAEALTTGLLQTANHGWRLEDVEENIEEKLIERREKWASGARAVIETGFPSLDMRNVVKTGRITILMGPTGLGKSLISQSIGISAALAGWPVLHVTTENTEEEALSRAEAALYGGDPEFLEMGANDKFIEKIRKGPKLEAPYKIVRLGREDTAASLVRGIYLAKYESGFVPKLVIIDSPDYLAVPNIANGSDRRALPYLITDSWQILKDFAEDTDTAVFATRHVKNVKKPKGEYLYDEFDGADSHGPQKLADVVMTANTNLHLKMLEMIELYVCKFRFRKQSKFSLWVKMEKGRFCEMPNPGPVVEPPLEAPF